MMTQSIEMRKRPHVIIATPGRLCDLVRSNQGEWSLGKCKFLVSSLGEEDQARGADVDRRFSTRQTASSLPRSHQNSPSSSTNSPPNAKVSSSPPLSPSPSSLSKSGNLPPGSLALSCTSLTKRAYSSLLSPNESKRNQTQYRHARRSYPALRLRPLPSSRSLPRLPPPQPLCPHAHLSSPPARHSRT